MTDPSPIAADWFFAEGLVGFPAWQRFRLEQTPELGPVALLHSLDEPELSFIIADPHPWHDGYAIEVAPIDLEQLGASEPAALQVFAILDVEADPWRVTANLLGPLVVNPTTGRARQIIQAGQPYLARQPINLEVDHARAEPAH